jgi:hypothetical protein
MTPPLDPNTPFGPMRARLGRASQLEFYDSSETPEEDDDWDLDSESESDSDASA